MNTCSQPVPMTPPILNDNFEWDEKSETEDEPDHGNVPVFQLSNEFVVDVVTIEFIATK